MLSRNLTADAVAAPEAPFDPVAGEYDAVFSHTPLGRHQRSIVHRCLAPLVMPGLRILELNCGTGEDALWMAGRGGHVLATDISAEMIAVTAAKAAGSPDGERIMTRRMAIEDLADPDLWSRLGRFDLILSDFDGLNCLADLSWLPEAVRSLLNPGGHLVLVFMNPACVMEMLYMLATLRPGRMLQRMRPQGIEVHIGEGRFIRTYFHGVGRVRRLFAPTFGIRRIEAVGLLTPPTLMRAVYLRFRTIFDALVPIERALAPHAPFNRLGDHVLFHFQAQETR